MLRNCNIPLKHILNTLILQSSSYNLCIIITITIIYTHPPLICLSHTVRLCDLIYKKHYCWPNKKQPPLSLFPSHRNTDKSQLISKCHTWSNKSHPCFQFRSRHLTFPLFTMVQVTNESVLLVFSDHTLTYVYPLNA